MESQVLGFLLMDMLFVYGKTPYKEICRTTGANSGFFGSEENIYVFNALSAGEFLCMSAFQHPNSKADISRSAE